MTDKKITVIEQVYTFQPDNRDISIDPEIIRVAIGYPLNHNDVHIDKIIDDVIRISKQKLEINSGYKIYNDV